MRVVIQNSVVVLLLIASVNGFSVRHIASDTNTRQWCKNGSSSSSSSSSTSLLSHGGLRDLFFAGVMGAVISMTTPAALAVSGGGLDYAGLDISGQNFAHAKSEYKGKDFTQGTHRRSKSSSSSFPYDCSEILFSLPTFSKCWQKPPILLVVIYKDVGFTKHSTWCRRAAAVYL